MGTSLTSQANNGTEYAWASQEDIESLPALKQRVQICQMVRASSSGDADQVAVEPALDRVINDLIVLDSFSIQSNGSGDSAFATGVIKAIKVDDRLVVHTTAGLRSQCNNWQEVEHTLMAERDGSDVEANSEIKAVHVVCVFSIGAEHSVEEKASRIKELVQQAKQASVPMTAVLVKDGDLEDNDAQGEVWRDQLSELLQSGEAILVNGVENDPSISEMFTRVFMRIVAATTRRAPADDNEEANDDNVFSITALAQQKDAKSSQEKVQIVKPFKEHVVTEDYNVVAGAIGSNDDGSYHKDGTQVTLVDGAGESHAIGLEKSRDLPKPKEKQRLGLDSSEDDHTQPTLQEAPLEEQLELNPEAKALLSVPPNVDGNDALQSGAASSQTKDEFELNMAIERIKQNNQRDVEQEKLVMEAQAQPLSSVSLARDILESINTTEFLLLSIQRSFSMKPHQVQSLLANHNQALLNVCEMGLPEGDFNKLISWYDYMSQDRIFRKMMDLIIGSLRHEKDIEVILVLNALKNGLYSPWEPVAKLCIRLLNKILSSLQECSRDSMTNFDTKFAIWFTKIVKNQTSDDSLFLHDSVLQSTVECLEMHDVLAPDVSRLILSVFKSQEIGGLAKLPALLKIAYAEDVFVVYETMHAILSDLSRLDRDQTWLALTKSSLIQDALFEATDDNGEVSLRLKCTNLLIEIWFEYPAIVYEPTMQGLGIGSLTMKDSFHFVLEQGTLERDTIFRSNIFANSFTLLDKLVQENDAETTVVYLTLVRGLLAMYRGKRSDLEIDKVSAELVLKGFADVFLAADGDELVPKSELIEPFLDQLTLNLHEHPASESQMTTCELVFLKAIVTRYGAALDEGTAVKFIDYFHLVSKMKPQMAHVLTLPQTIGDLARAFAETSQVMRHVEKTLVPDLLEAYRALKKEEMETSQKRKRQVYRQDRSPGIRKARQAKQDMEREVELDRNLKRHMIVTQLDKLHSSLAESVHQDNLVRQVKKAAQSYQQVFMISGADSNKVSSLQTLFNKWHNLSRQGASPGSDKRIVAIPNSPSTSPIKGRKGTVDWQRIKEPSNPIALRAVEQYQALKQKQIERKNNLLMEEAKKKQKQDRLNSEAKLQVAKRGLMLERDSIIRQQKLKAIFGGESSTSLAVVDGVQTEPTTVLAQQVTPRHKNQHESITAAIFKASTAAKKVSLGGQKVALADDLDKMSLKEQEAIKNVLKKHAKLLKYLFEAYLDSTRDVLQQTHTVNEKLIAMTDLMRLFREHNMDHTILAKSEFLSLTQLINERLLKPYDDDALNFAGFIQFFWQSAIFCHKQQRLFRRNNKAMAAMALKDYKHTESVPQMIDNLVTWFKVAVKARDRTLVGVYEYPELAEDPSKALLLLQLNEKVKNDPNLALPSGFVLSKDVEEVKEYGLTAQEKEKLGEGQVAALEVIEDILVRHLAMHLKAEPTVTRKETYIVKLATQHVRSQSNQRIQDSGQALIHSSGGNSGSLITSAYRGASPMTRLGMKKFAERYGKVDIRAKNKNNGSRSVDHGVTPKAQYLSNNTIQNILQTTYDDEDIYGLGLTQTSKINTKQNNSIATIPSLSIYKTENILKIVDAKRQQYDESLSLMSNGNVLPSRAINGRNKAGLGMSIPTLPNSRFKGHHVPPASSQHSLTNASSASLNSNGKQQTSAYHENLLLQSDLSNDLKSATYALQLASKAKSGSHSDLEPIRQTALVLEDMLRAIDSGNLDSYQYSAVRTLAATEARTQALHLRNKGRVMIKQRALPGDTRSRLTLLKLEEKKEKEEMEKKAQQARDLARIQRSMVLKQKLSLQYSSSSQHNTISVPQIQSGSKRQSMGGNSLMFSSAGEDSDEDRSKVRAGLDSITVLNPTQRQKMSLEVPQQLDQKKLSKLRAKQLQMSLAEREARKQVMAQNGQALLEQDRLARKNAAIQAKQKIDKKNEVPIQEQIRIAKSMAVLRKPKQIKRPIVVEDVDARTKKEHWKQMNAEERAKRVADQAASLERLYKVKRRTMPESPRAGNKPAHRRNSSLTGPGASDSREEIQVIDETSSASKSIRAIDVQKPKAEKDASEQIDWSARLAQHAQEKMQKAENDVKMQIQEQMDLQRQDLEDVYLTHDVQTILMESSDQLRALYGRVADGNLLKIDERAYLAEFGEFESGLIPTILQKPDLQVIFDRTVNDFRLPGDPKRKESAQLMSYESFKVSLVLLASMCQATKHRLRKEKEEWQAEKAEKYEAFGGVAPTEFDEAKEAVIWKELISLDKLPLSPMEFAEPASNEEDKLPHSDRLQRAITGGKGFTIQTKAVQKELRPLIFNIANLEPERLAMVIKYILTPKIRKRHHVWNEQDIASQQSQQLASFQSRANSVKNNSEIMAKRRVSFEDEIFTPTKVHETIEPQRAHSQVVPTFSKSQFGKKDGNVNEESPKGLKNEDDAAVKSPVYHASDSQLIAEEQPQLTSQPGEFNDYNLELDEEPRLDNQVLAEELPLQLQFDEGSKQEDQEEPTIFVNKSKLNAKSELIKAIEESKEEEDGADEDQDAALGSQRKPAGGAEKTDKSVKPEIVSGTTVAVAADVAGDRVNADDAGAVENSERKGATAGPADVGGKD